MTNTDSSRSNSKSSDNHKNKEKKTERGIRSNEEEENDYGNIENKAKSEILEKGDIFFFYRPKANSREVKGIEDIRRYFMLTVPETQNKKGQKSSINSDSSNIKKIYRLFVIGKKALPEIRETEARRSERFWAKVGGIYNNDKDIVNDLFSEEFSEGDIARPVGEGKYAIVKYHNHTELAYILETPKEPGPAQQELGIEKEASYVVSVINPEIPTPKNYPTAEQPPKYPEEILRDFDRQNFVSLAKNLDFINYLNAQVILIGAREGKDTIKEELGID
ncbi:MAG: hypothetical protein M3162_04490, partial [Thermoproteota archaeon]|nr:hypothetical protein [Thermoproteota archaeon]